jgi:hypothetical protein
LAVSCRSCTVVGRACAIAFGTQDDVVSARVLQIVLTRELVTIFCGSITTCRGPITIRRCFQPGRGRLVAYCLHGGTVMTRPSPNQSAPAVGDLVATSREIVVGGMLILICAPLISRTRTLVVV